MMRKLIVCVYCSMLVGSLCAQWPFGGPLVYPEKLREDLELMRGLVHRSHPDPYRYCTRAELDRLFDAVRDSMVVPLRTDEFQTMLIPVFQRIGDANLHPDLDETTAGAMRSTASVLPLKVRVTEEGLYVEEELKGFRSLPPGSCIVTINDRPTADILERLGRFVIVDGANNTLRWKLVEQDFPWLLLRAFGEVPMFRLGIITPDGEPKEVELFAMTGSEMDLLRKPDTHVLPWYSEWEASSGTLWVTMPTLDNATLEGSGQNAAHFMSDMLKDLKQNEARTLVLDLRNAGGRELGMAELVFSSIARSPFRVIQGMTVRGAMPPDLYGIVEPQPEHYASVAVNYIPDVNGNSSLRPDDERLEPIAALPRAFEGTVYVVCDGATRDAAAAFVMLAKRSGRARIIGEETGTNAYSFTGGRELVAKMPNSGLRLRVPLVRYLPDGEPVGPADNGEQPHHSAQQQSWGIEKGRDTVRLSLLQMIMALQ